MEESGALGAEGDDSGSEMEAEPDELYDERKDDKDARFVQARRVSGVTDGTLSCPCCFTVVCYECQQHASYAHQFRAVTAVNVQIKHDKALQHAPLEEGGVPETYSPVACRACGYELAVFGPDDEQTYHFFAVTCSDPQ